MTVDLNRNNNVDKNLIGIPIEQCGFSYDTKGIWPAFVCGSFYYYFELYEIGNLPLRAGFGPSGALLRAPNSRVKLT